MPPVRIFLGWNQPALAQAAELLLARYARSGAADLNAALVVLPGARAGRRLLEILVERAETSGLALTPPRIATVGGLPENLYEPQGRFADRLSGQLAWLRSLQETDVELLRRIVPEPPDRNDAARWLALADLANRLHTELGGHGLKFADVVERGFRAEDAIEVRRWQAMAAVQDRYLRQLERLGILDAQISRLNAVQTGACRAERDVILVGVADLPSVVEKMLEQVADRVTALIYAPEQFADRFTRLGTIVAGAWRQAHIELDDEQLIVVEGPADQARATVEIMAGYEGRYAAEEITIGVPDESVVPFIERRFEQFDILSRYAEGLRLRKTAPHRLLAAVADYLDGERFTAFAALVRHPDLEVWLAGDAAGGNDFEDAAGDWLTALDAWHSEHLQAACGVGVSPASEPGGPALEDSAVARRVAAVEKKVHELCRPFCGQRPLEEWAKEIAALMVAVYGRRQLDRNHTRGRVALEACEAIHGVLLEAFAADAQLAGRWSAADALRLLLRQIEDEPIPPLAGHSAVELLGWLELPLDDAPALVVTGFNDGFVPSFINADPFLPNGLRRKLGLLDNERRYARDAYALAVLVGSRRDLRLVAGRRSAESDPLTPSRLAFACPREKIAGRVLGYFGVGSSRARPWRTPHGLPAGRSKSTFQTPAPLPLKQPITSMRVTQFRDYLACPYRFYLRHVLELSRLNDLAEELDPAAFGSLAHDALKAFGEVPDNSRLTDAAKIRAALDAELDRIVVGRYGKQRLPAVDIQVRHLRLRLAAFARWQAAWAAQGWRIVKTEVEIKDGQAPFIVDGQPMFLRARIDRVDRNESDGRHVIFDYKTSDSGADPEKTHRKKNEWVDLQLPLYWHLKTAVQIDGDDVGLGYIVLPKDLDAVQCRLASWTLDDLGLADKAAAEVIRKIRMETFWPPGPGSPFDEFAAICQERQLGCRDDDEESPL